VLLKSYTKEIFRPECNPSFQSLHCIARLDQDVSEVLPYLNSALGGFEYFKDPPAVTFRVHGKIITVHPRQIAVNALRDEDEAEKILRWLQREINEAWEKRGEIKPRYEGSPKPKVLEILRLLPQTNCRECGQLTCMVFAALVTQGVKGPGDCPPLAGDARKRMDGYMGQFALETDMP
jgi:ArsR family metal-binding transcriptional regulator